MSFDEFAEMMEMKKYSKVIVTEGGSGEVRKHTILDMPEIHTNKKVEKISVSEITKKDGVEYFSKEIKLEFTDDQKDMEKEICELRESKKEYAQKNKTGRKFYVGYSVDRSFNKTGNILYKGDHLWALIGDSNYRYLFLMTGNSEETITFQFIRKLRDDYHYKDFCKEVTNKWKNYDELAKKNWKNFLGEPD